MHITVKNVFFILMYAVIAAILYLIFFGWNTKVTETTYETSNSFIGVLGVAAVSVEKSIAQYYNDYVFLPTVQTSNSLAVKYLGVLDKSASVNLADNFGQNTTSSAPAPSGSIKATYSASYNGYSNTKINYN